MAKRQENKWSQPAQPPPPMFFNEKERNFTRQIANEIQERIIGQTVVYYPISREHTNYHSVYGEAIEKTFLSPVRVYALVTWNGKGKETSAEDSFGLDQVTKITVKFHKRRITEDQNLNVRVGDFVQYGSFLYEITKTAEPRELFGQQEFRFEVVAECIRSRQGLFDAQ
jgi:hypothetical protein